MATHLQTRMDRVLQDLKDQYAKHVRNNPDTVAQIESAFRILSFLVAGRFENGELISELMYSASNLLIFLNDNIFKAASKYLRKVGVTQELLQRWLTILEYCEVFLEMAAKKKWGAYGAWVVITVIQITKTVLRLYLFMKLDSGIQTTPPIQPADRELLKADQENLHDNLEDAWDEEEANTAQEKTFTLKSSGRKVRTLKSAQNNGQRTWDVPMTPQDTQKNMLMKKWRHLNQPPTTLTRKRFWAEGLHIVRPLAHLLAMYGCGQESWKPLLLACGMDLCSISLMGETKDLNHREKAELKRRNLMLLYYLLRSPFYDTYSKAKIFAFLIFLANHVPLAGFIARPVMEYLPVWQKMYFYVWSS